MSNYPEKWTGKLVGKMHINRITNRDLANELGMTEQYVSMLLTTRSNSEKGRQKLEAAFDAIIQKRKSEGNQSGTGRSD